MTDLEMTKLAAEAMGLDWDSYNKYCEDYDPLHNDAQAMALVKKFGLYIHCGAYSQGWYAESAIGTAYTGVRDDDLNRAIVECVAKMQKAK